MKLRGFSKAIAPFAVMMSALISGCGGGDSPSLPQPTAVTITGVAAVGAPLAGGTVRIYDTSTNVVGGEALVGADGTYTYVIPPSAKGPFVASVTSGDIMLYSPLPQRTDGTLNITPLTDLVAALLSPTGDASALATQAGSGAADLSAAQVASKVQVVLDALSPLLENVGNATNPLTGRFAADGTGHDRVLNSLNITINRSGTHANISITVKAAVPDGSQPPSISFTSDQALPPLPASVAGLTLPASDTDTLLTKLMARMTQCYRLPLASRVTGSGSGAVLSASECQAMFKGGRASNYKHAGPVSGTVNAQATGVGPNGAFADLFADDATGSVFDQGRLEFVSTNGSSALSFRRTSSAGSATYGRVVVVRESDEFRLAGNQYDYPMSIRPYAADFDYLAAPAYRLRTTAYNISILNLRVEGVSVFDRVLVTMPNGLVLTYRPAGFGFLVVERPGGSLSDTSLHRLAAAFIDPATAGTPRQHIPTVWAPNPAGEDADWTESEITAIPAVSSWKAEVFLAGNTGSTPDAVQYLQTLARPFTLPELQQQKWMEFTEGVRSELAAGRTADGYAFSEGQRLSVRPAAGGDGWTVSPGAFAPSSISAIGTVPGSGGWNQTPAVSTLDRSVVIDCTAPEGNPRCATGGGFAPGVLLQTLVGFAYDGRDRERAKALRLVNLD